MSDKETMVIIMFVAMFMVLIVAIVDSSNANQKSNCVINTSKQNLTADEISKLCGWGNE